MNNYYAFIKQIISYFFVGGISAVVEWVVFLAITNIIGLHYMISTCVAFFFSTTTNWYLGRKWTFKDNKEYVDKKSKEIVLVFLVSAVGLLFNIILMYIFVEIFQMNTALLKGISKVCSTGLVFIWNFLIRRYVIYNYDFMK